MRTPLIAIITFVSVGIFTAAQPTAEYSASDAAKHVGESATVTDIVSNVHESGKGNIFLNMGGAYPNQAFTGFIPASAASKFSDARQYGGQTVSISGKISLYKGKPEIVINSPSQIRKQ
jgi:DNA/RNA endonuclease YhcR with UshA esterase domain